MLGLILYEVFDILFYAGKLGYNGLKAIYNWYYGMSAEDKAKYTPEQIELLENKMKEIEELLKQMKETMPEKKDELETIPSGKITIENNTANKNNILENIQSSHQLSKNFIVNNSETTNVHTNAESNKLVKNIYPNPIFMDKVSGVDSPPSF